MNTDTNQEPTPAAIRPPAIAQESLRLRAIEAAYLREIRSA